MESQTDIGDKGWDDLHDADYDLLRELASERDGVRGDGSREAICAGLLAYHDRADEVPEEYRDEIPDDLRNDAEGSDNDSAADESETDDTDDSDNDSAEDESETDETEEEEPEESGSADGGGSEAVPVPKDYTPPQTPFSVIVEASALQAWVEHVDTLVEECKVIVSADGLQTRAVDPANVGMVEASLHATAAESYDPPENPGLIGIDIGRFGDVVGDPNQGELIHLEYDPTRRNVVVNYGPHEFTIALIDPDSIRQMPDIPDLDLPAEVVFEDANTIVQAVNYGDDITDHLDLEATNERELHIVGQGDTDDYEGTFRDNEEIRFNKVPGEPVLSKFSLDYLTDMVSPFGSEEVTVEVGPEFPTKIRAKIHDGEGDVAGQVEYMLAPRIQSD